MLKKKITSFVSPTPIGLPAITAANFAECYHINILTKPTR